MNKPKSVKYEIRPTGDKCGLVVWMIEEFDIGRRSTPLLTVHRNAHVPYERMAKNILLSLHELGLPEPPTNVETVVYYGVCDAEA